MIQLLNTGIVNVGGLVTMAKRNSLLLCFVTE